MDTNTIMMLVGGLMLIMIAVWIWVKRTKK